MAGTSTPRAGQPATPRRTALLPGVLDQHPETGKDPLVAVQPRVAGWDGAGIDRRVGVPEEHRVVADGAGQERDIGEAGVQGRSVQDRAVSVLVRARVEAGPRGTAGSGIGPVVRKEDASGGQRVQRRGLQHGVAEGRQTVTAPLVQSDKEDVAWRGHDATVADRGTASRSRASRCPPEPGRPAGWRCATHRRAQDVRTVAPPKRVPNEINHVPTAWRTARPPVTGSPEAEHCVVSSSELCVECRRVARRDPAEETRA